MAGLLRDTRGSMLLGGSVLSAITIAIALEAAFSHTALRPGLAGVFSVVLLGSLIGCWLRAVALLLLAGRPLLDQLNDHRWRTGGPVDPRVKWLTLPTIEDSAAELELGPGEPPARRGTHPAGADPPGRYLDLYHRCLFLAWTAAIFLGP